MFCGIGVGLGVRATLLSAVAALFAAGEPGVAFVDFDASTLFQDTAGTVPIAPGKSVALALDKSKGLVLGAELVTNGDFSSSANWTLDPSATISGGTLNINNASSVVSASQTFPLVAGRTYEFRATCTSFTSGSVALGTKTGTVVSAFSINATGSYRALVVAGAANDGVRLITQGAGFVGSLDNISVRELPGNHASQPIFASQPIYGIEPVGGRRNLLTYTEDLSQSVWSKVQGTVSGTRFTPNTTAGVQHRLDQTPASPAGAQVFWAVLKYAGYRWASLRIGAVGASFDVLNGAVGTYVDVGVTRSITDLGDGQYLCAIFVAAAVANDTARIGVEPADTMASNFAGDGTSGIDVIRAQLEVGTSVSAYQKVVSQYEVVEVPKAQLSYLSFDGLDDFMVTPSIDFTATDKMTVFTGVRKLSDAAAGILTELSATPTVSNGTFSVQTPPTASDRYAWYSRGTIGAFPQATGYAAPITNVLSAIGDIAADIAIIRVNGSQVASVSTDQGTGNYGNHPLYIGARAGTSVPFNGRLYSLIVRGAASTADQIASTEAWVNQRTGAY